MSLGGIFFGVSGRGLGPWRQEEAMEGQGNTVGGDRESRDFAEFRESGDPRALGRVFDSVAGELYRVALHLSGDPVDAEDLLQTCFLLAIEKAERYESHRPVRPWLLGLLANALSANVSETPDLPVITGGR